MAKLHARPSLQYRYEHYDPIVDQHRGSTAALAQIDPTKVDQINKAASQP
jgi:hypothetical protein